MARNNNWQSVRPIGDTHGPRDAWVVAQALRNVGVRNRFSIRDLAQFIPDFDLELRAVFRQWQVELGPFAREILRELSFGLI